MDRSWFDAAADDLGVGFHTTRRSVLESRTRWTSSASHTDHGVAAASVSHRRSFLEESRDLDQELQATSARLREASRASNQTGFMNNTGFATRRLGLAERFDDLMRSTGDGGRFQIGEVGDLTKKLQAIQEENQKLQAVITDVTDVNKRWQKYNNDRQMYVQRLLSTIQDQQEEMSKAVDSQSISSKEQDSPDNSYILSEKMRLQDELKQQRSRLECVEKEYREHVAVLEFQVKAHRDDWEAERSEKQQLLKDKMAAEAKVKQLQKDVRCLKMKLREERLENATPCCCNGSHACEPEHRADMFVPSAKLSPCHRDHTQNKTYRTSVHLPCTSGHLLPRGTTLCFGDDLTVDCKTTNNLDKQDSSTRILRSRSNSDEDSELSMHNLIEKTKESQVETDLPPQNNLNIKSVSHVESIGNSAESVFAFEPNELSIVQDADNSTVHKERVYQSASTPNLITPTTPRLSCSVLHITPSQTNSIASLPFDNEKIDSTSDIASGVTIGFSNNGLASVFSFPQTPIVKSFSLPTSKRGEIMGTSLECSIPVSQTSSLGSSWSGLSIASPPSQTFETSTESISQEKKSTKLSVLGAFAKSMKQSKENGKSVEQLANVDNEQASNKKAVTWKSKYFEEGIATQTKEDLICPGCGQIFPPILHVTFLDHFEKECQNTKREQQNIRKKSS